MTVTTSESDDGVADIVDTLGSHSLVDVIGQTGDTVQNIPVTRSVLHDEYDIGG